MRPACVLHDLDQVVEVGETSLRRRGRQLRRRQSPRRAWSSSAWRRPVTKTRAPSAANSLAVARPMPVVPP